MKKRAATNMQLTCERQTIKYIKSKLHLYHCTGSCLVQSNCSISFSSSIFNILLHLGCTYLYCHNYVQPSSLYYVARGIEQVAS